MRLPSLGRRHENVESNRVSALKGNPFAVRRPAGIQVVCRGRELGDQVESGTVFGRGYQLDALFRQPKERKPPIRWADVSSSHAVDDTPWHATKCRDLPDAPLNRSLYGRRKIQ